MTETVKQCQLCELRTSSMSFLLRHLAMAHSTRPGFFFTCGLNHCQRTFQNITTYKHHVYSQHAKGHTNLVVVTESDPSSDQTNESDGDQSDGESDDDDFGDARQSDDNFGDAGQSDDDDFGETGDGSHGQAGTCL